MSQDQKPAGDEPTDEQWERMMRGAAAAMRNVMTDMVQMMLPMPVGNEGIVKAAASIALSVLLTRYGKEHKLPEEGFGAYVAEHPEVREALADEVLKYVTETVNDFRGMKNNIMVSSVGDTEEGRAFHEQNRKDMRDAVAAEDKPFGMRGVQLP